MKTFFATLFLILFGVTLYWWADQGFKLYGEGPAMAGGLFAFVGVPCGCIAALLLWWQRTSRA